MGLISRVSSRTYRFQHMGNVNTAGPNEAVVVSGGCGSSSKSYTVSGWAWNWWIVSEVNRLSLNVLTLKPQCTSVETRKGVPLTVTAVAQVKVMYNPKATDKKAADQMLAKACENFLGKTHTEIENLLKETLEGHLRSMLGQLTVEEVYKDREQFAQQVRETASPDVGKMGIEILSFVIQDIRDDVDYLTSIGKAQTAAVQKEAVIGSTNADRDAKIKEADCSKAVNDAEAISNTNIDNARKYYETTKQQCDTKINKAKTEASLAYDLQQAKEEQVIRDAELEVEVIQRRKQIEVEEAEVIRREKELEATQRKPAEFNAMKIELLADGERKAKVLVAEAEAQRIKLIGQAKAEALEKTGSAKAKGMQMKAEAMQQYGRQAMVQMVLESLPSLAAEVSRPLEKIDEIVLLGGENDRTSTKVGQLLAEGPAVVKALTGVDISTAMNNLK